jgi:hypothetical protein
MHHKLIKEEEAKKWKEADEENERRGRDVETE